MILANELKIEIQEDRPTGMHVSPNPYWITVTHVPSMSSVRVYSSWQTSQHKVHSAALACLEMLVEEFGGKCAYPERLEK